jgi:hypothetical protein
MKIAYFSERAAEQCGSFFYLLKDGREVEVTALIEDRSSYKWPDAVALGEPERYLRKGRKGAMLVFAADNKQAISTGSRNDRIGH